MLGSIILRLLAFMGGDLFQSVVSKVADYFHKKAAAELDRHRIEVNADAQIALARINAEIEARKIQAQLLAADRGWWVTAWIRPLLVYPCVVHFAGVVLDSTPFWTPFGPHVVGAWGIEKLPAPYDFYEQTVILSFFIARPFEKVARVFSTTRKQ
jgi:hypothetical protein